MVARKITSGVTLLVLCLVLVLGAVVGWKALTSGLGTPSADPSASPSCETTGKPAGRVRARDVTVSVYNAGTKAGWASRTLRMLERRGFTAGEAGNAPEGTNVRKVEVWAQDVADPAALLVARQFGKRTQVVKKTDPGGAGVDVVVGNRFRKLARAPRSIKGVEPDATC